MAELRITDTNSANDSRGRAFGLEGNDFVYVLVALVAAMGLYVVCTAVLHFRIVPALVLAIPVFVVPAAWVVFLRHNKPAGYAADWFENFINREGWSQAPGAQPLPFRERTHEQPTA
jgi:hypothetical protein